MKLYDHIQKGGCMQDFLIAPAPGELPKEDIESLTERTEKCVAEFEEVVFGDPEILKLEDILSICESLQHQKDVEIKRCREGVAIVELTRKKKEKPDKVSGGKPGMVYRPAVVSRRTGKVYNMTVQ